MWNILKMQNNYVYIYMWLYMATAMQQNNIFSRQTDLNPPKYI